MSMITATAWVPRGAAAQFPTRFELNEVEFDRIAKLAKLQLDKAKEDLEEAKATGQAGANGHSNGVVVSNTNGEIDDDLREYDLDHYDDEPDDDDAEEDAGGVHILGNVKALAYHGSNEEDPYITLQDDEEDSDEREELQILATDNLILAARIEDEVAHLEVYVYEDEADNLYVHHDIMLPAIPLTVEWLDLPLGRASGGSDSKGNFVAVGTMDPDIELWDLDTVDSLYPNVILGQGAEDDRAGEKPRKKKKKSRKVRDEYHVDAVLSIAANRQHRNLLASASADKTVKLWDLNITKCAKSYSYHTDKVCSLGWHPLESSALLSGSYDRTVVAADMRAPDAGVRTWTVESDVENVRWDPHDPNCFYVSTESGALHFFDARVAPLASSLSRSVWMLQAHDASVSSFDINPTIPGFLVTGSTDKQVKLWNVQANGPSMVISRDLGVGRVFSTVFAPDTEVSFRLAVAGSKGALQVWDTSTNAAVRNAFATRMGPTQGEVKERLVGVQIDSAESDSDEEDDDTQVGVNGEE